MKSIQTATEREDLPKKRIPAPVKEAVAALLDKNAQQVVVMKLKGRNEFTDLMIVCHGLSTRQNKALAEHLEERLLTKYRLKPFSVEGCGNAEWILVDYVDFVVHVFIAEARRRYDLEKLWMDAKQYLFTTDKNLEGPPFS